MTRINYILALFLISSFSMLCVQAASVLFRDCGKGEIESISLEPCAAAPCHFEQGDHANLSITFVPKESAKGVIIKNTLRTLTGFIKMEVKEEDPNVCRSDPTNASEWGKLECPLQPDKRYTFIINRAFPSSTTYNIFRYSMLRFLSDDGRLIACADMRLRFHLANSWQKEQLNKIDTINDIEAPRE